MDYKGININVEVLSKYKDEELAGWLKDNGLEESELSELKKAIEKGKKEAAEAAKKK